jgi:hypothetical protein
MGLVIPDERKTLRNGAIKPMQTPAWKDCQDDLMKYAGEAGIPRDTAWSQLTPAQRDWVIDGSPNWSATGTSSGTACAASSVPGEQGLQDAHPCALVQVPQLHALRHCGGARLKTWRRCCGAWVEGRCRCRAAAGKALPAGGRGLVARAAGGLPGLQPARPDAAADRAAAPLLRRPDLPSTHARRSAEAAAATRCARAALPVRRRPGLPDAGPPEPHAVRAARCSAST